MNMMFVMTTFSNVLHGTVSTSSRSYFLDQESEEWVGLIDFFKQIGQSCNRLSVLLKH